MAKSDVLIPEEIGNSDLDATINTTLQKNNVTDMVIASLKDKYGSLRLKSIDDKEGYLEIKAANKEVRKWEILTEDLCEKGRADAIAIQKKWISKQKEILGKFNEVRNPLGSEMKRYEDEIARKDAEESKRKEEAVINRQAALSKMGAQYQNGCFVLDDVSFDASLIKEADDDVWENSILSKYKLRYEKNESVRIAEENKRKEEQEKLRLQQEEMARKEREFAEREAALKKAEDDRLAADKAESDRKLAEHMAKEDEKIKRRCNQMQALGLKYDFGDAHYKNYGCFVPILDIQCHDEEAWNNLVEGVTEHIKAKQELQKERDDLQSKRLNELLPYNPYGSDVRMTMLWDLSEEEYSRILENKKSEFQKEQDKKQRDIEEAAAKKERERIKDEQIQAALKIHQDALRKQEELNQASDKEKWSAILEQINKIQWHEMKSGPYRRKLSIAKEKISEIQEL